MSNGYKRTYVMFTGCRCERCGRAIVPFASCYGLGNPVPELRKYMHVTCHKANDAERATLSTGRGKGEAK